MNTAWDDVQHEPTNELFALHRLGCSDLAFVILVRDRHHSVLVAHDPVVGDRDTDDIVATVFDKEVDVAKVLE